MKRIIFLGDSITEAFPLNSLLSEYSIINMGIFGDRTDLVLQRLESDIIALKPDSIFILIGTNDMASLYSDETILTNYGRILLTLCLRLPNARIYVEAILPTRSLENRPLKRIQHLNTELEKISAKKNVFFLDVYTWFLNDAGEISDRYSDDGLHLTLEGYKRWVEFLRPVLEKEISGKQ